MKTKLKKALNVLIAVSLVGAVWYFDLITIPKIWTSITIISVTYLWSTKNTN